jgi:hypothetical protein
MADAADLHREVVRVERLAAVESAERDFRGSYQAEVRILDAVNLGFRSTGKKADALENMVLCQVRRGREREPFGLQDPQHVACNANSSNTASLRRK